MHKVSLYVNGYVDLQGSVQNFNAFDNAQCVLGKYRSVPSFSGSIENLYLFMYSVNQDEIFALMQEAQEYRAQLALEEHAQKVKGQSEHIEHTEGYLARSKLPAGPFMQLGV